MGEEGGRAPTVLGFGMESGLLDFTSVPVFMTGVVLVTFRGTYLVAFPSMLFSMNSFFLFNPARYNIRSRFFFRPEGVMSNYLPDFVFGAQ